MPGKSNKFSIRQAMERPVSKNLARKLKLKVNSERVFLRLIKHYGKKAVSADLVTYMTRGNYSWFLSPKFRRSETGQKIISFALGDLNKQQKKTEEKIKKLAEEIEMACDNKPRINSREYRHYVDFVSNLLRKEHELQMGLNRILLKTIVINAGSQKEIKRLLNIRKSLGTPKEYAKKNL